MLTAVKGIGRFCKNRIIDLVSCHLGCQATADPFIQILHLDRLFNPLCRKCRSLAYDPDCPCLPAPLLHRSIKPFPPELDW